MREIEFRGKDIKYGDWLYGSLQIDGEYTAIKEQGRAWPNALYMTVDRETVGQYTGLKDKNGEKVFEGDIVRHKGFGVKQATWGSSYDSLSSCCAFMWNGTIAFLSTNETDRCEVIGNIHDNPELLKGEEK